MLPAQALAMSALGAPRYSLFMLMQTSTGPVRAWLGVGDYDLPADDVDTEGGTYLGIGLVGQIPALRQLVGGVAERVEFVLNGVDPVTFGLADENADEVRNALVNVGIIFFDEDWQAADDIAWLWDGTADTVATDHSADASGRMARRVALSVGSAFTDRTRPKVGFYTPTDQKRLHPTDTACDRVPGMSPESTVIWPHF